MAVGLFGKLPSAGDFVAVGASQPVAQLFQRWLQGENDQLVARQLAVPDKPIRFLFRDPSGTGAIIGLLAPSRDTVGRTFPLTFMAHVDAPVAVQRFPSLPAAYAPFLDGAAQLFAQAPQSDPRALYASLSSLRLPGPQDLAEAHTWTHQALDATPGQNMLEALFGPLHQGVHYHGIHMFRAACERVRGSDPGQAGIYLECPCVDDVQLAFWLVFAKGQLNWRRAPPAFFWTDSASQDRRLILSLGSPGPGTLTFLADPSLKAERLWPTLTTSSASVDAGRHALSTAERRSFEPPAPTASALLAALAVANPRPKPG